MKSALRITSSFLGICAGLLAMEYGVFEILHGQRVPEGLLIHAIGPPCQADAVWHACYPALTLIPNLFISGTVAIVAS